MLNKSTKVDDLKFLERTKSIWQLVEAFIVISPEVYFFYIWKIAVMIICIGSSILYSYFAAFRRDVDYAGKIAYYEYNDPYESNIHFFTEGEIDNFNLIETCIESFFIVVMVTEFLTAYIDGDNHLIKDLKKIYKRYLFDGFIFDLIPLIPFSSYLHFNYSRYLYFLKCIRMIKAF